MKTITALVASFDALAVPASAAADNTGTPPGPPQLSGGDGTMVFRCSFFDDSVAGAEVVNKNGVLRGFCFEPGPR